MREFSELSLVEPIDAFSTSLADSPTVDVPTPTISYPSDWQAASAMNDPEPVANDLAWETTTVKQADPEPTIVHNKSDDGYSLDVPLASLPVDYHEVPLMLAYEDPYASKGGSVCNCIDYPCNCDGTLDPYKPGGLTGFPPPPIVNGPIEPGKLTAIDPPVSQPYPVVNVSIATQTPTTQQVAPAGDAADDETAMIFGYPWYYAVGAGLAAMFLLSSMDGGKRR